MDRRWKRSRAAAVATHRSFDPRIVGRLETEAWVAYYRRQWGTLLIASIGLTRHTFGLPWPSTLLGAWLVLRANQLWHLPRQRSRRGPTHDGAVLPAARPPSRGAG